MIGEIEFDKCDIGGKEAQLDRKYYHYPIKCQCHGPLHFELVKHCSECVPQPPKKTTVTLQPSPDEEDDNLYKIRKMGVYEAWCICRSDLENNVLVVAIPKDITCDSVSELRHLLGDLFPEDEGKPVSVIVPEDFKFGLEARADVEKRMENDDD